MAGDKVQHFDDSNFESDVLNADTPVLVDFWAEWCGPCQLLAPVIDDLANEYDGKVRVGKVDVDKSPHTAAKYGIQNIPTVVLFDKGQAVERIVGAKSKAEYQNLLNSKTGVS